MEKFSSPALDIDTPVVMMMMMENWKSEGLSLPTAYATNSNGTGVIDLSIWMYATERYR